MTEVKDKKFNQDDVSVLLELRNCGCGDLYEESWTYHTNRKGSYKLYGLSSRLIRQSSVLYALDEKVVSVLPLENCLTYQFLLDGSIRMISRCARKLATMERKDGDLLGPLSFQESCLISNTPEALLTHLSASNIPTSDWPHQLILRFGPLSLGGIKNALHLLEGNENGKVIFLHSCMEWRSPQLVTTEDMVPLLSEISKIKASHFQQERFIEWVQRSKIKPRSEILVRNCIREVVTSHDVIPPEE
jgi:hypothetical protein